MNRIAQFLGAKKCVMCILMSPVAKSFFPKDLCQPFGRLQFRMFYDVLCLDIGHLSLDLMFNPYIISIYIYVHSIR